MRNSRLALVAAAAAGLLALTYGPTLVWLAGRWWTDPFYSHGPLIPIVSAYLLWAGRRGLSFNPALSLPAVLVLAAAAALLLLGARLRFELLSSLSLVLTLGGIALLAGGRSLLRIAAFPLAYLLLAIPLPMVVLQKISLPLQLLSSAGSSVLLQGLGCPVTRQSVVLSFPGFALAVADACSGLRSLITVLAISALAARLVRASLRRKLLLVGLGLAAALVANVFRISLSGLIGLSFGGETAVVFFEHYSGYVFFLVVILAMLGAFALLGGRREDRPEEPVSPPPVPVAPRLLALKVLLPLALVLGPAAGAAYALRAARPLPPPSRLADWQPSLGPWRILDVRRPPSFLGEELLAGTLEGPAGRKAGFTLLHSVSGRYLHSPEACSQAAGWIPERQEIRDLPSGDGPPLPVNSWLMRRGNERVWLLFWFDLSGKPARGTLGQHAGALWNRLWRGRVDSTYGEVASPFQVGEPLPPEDLLLDLSRALHREAGARLR